MVANSNGEALPLAVFQDHAMQKLKRNHVHIIMPYQRTGHACVCNAFCFRLS